jgi:signal transduction histidine kinase
VTLPAELHPALLQAAITIGLALLSWTLHRRYRKPYYAWWTIAWLLYTMRVGAIMQFLLTEDWDWLYWHQVLTGWTALALLRSAMVFSLRPGRARWWVVASLFPPLWSYVAIHEFDNFMAAALPAVGFLSAATIGTAWVFVRHWREVRSPGALVLAQSFLLWGLHHLDYPFLRARGAWVPWGYYLDILFTLAVGAGMLLLVMDDLQQGIRTMSALAVNPARAGDGDVVRDTVERPLSLPAVRGAALFTLDGEQPRCAAGAGVCEAWAGQSVHDEDAAVVARAITAGRVQTGARLHDPLTGHRFAYAAVIPLFSAGDVERARSALAIVGDARDPFAALDERFLLALGHQAGRAIEREELRRGLVARSEELQRLSTRMVAQHEDERRRISLELHDETAQVFAAVTMRLGLIRERADVTLADDLADVLELVEEGMRSVRRVAYDLRPALLDDLGLLPALRALGAAVAGRSGMRVDVTIAEAIPPLPPEGEAALFRALQELLTNVVRHARATHVQLSVTDADGTIVLVVDDDGRGFAEMNIERLEAGGHAGLAGMRERVTVLGGSVSVKDSPLGGARVVVQLPARVQAMA